ncbi:hypothetical protein H0H93_006059 [Arthromyces matolae]|nr:hypothetical protein H0H93_006059 [Arthromyces matolae]
MTEALQIEIAPDLFYPILWHYEDLTTLWLYREVSRDFADAVERVFIHKHLRKTSFHLDCGVSSKNFLLVFEESYCCVSGMFYPNHRKVSLACDLTFDRVDPSNRSRAFFSDKECAPEFQAELKKRFKSKLEYGNPIHSPEIHVRIRRDVNDTATPDLEVNFNNLQISLNWKGMYSAFFKEDREYNKRLNQSLKSAFQGTEGRVERGEMNFEDQLRTMFEGFADKCRGLRKTLRRGRIRKEVLEKDGIEWKFSDDDGGEEDGVLQTLSDYRQMMGFASYGDSESEEEDTDGRDEDSRL